MGRSGLNCRNRSATKGRHWSNQFLRNVYFFSWRLLERRRLASSRNASSSASTGNNCWNRAQTSNIDWQSIPEYADRIFPEEPNGLDLLEIERYPFKSSTLENALVLGGSSQLSPTINDEDLTSPGNTDEMLDSPFVGMQSSPVEHSVSTAPSPPAEDGPCSLSEDPHDILDKDVREQGADDQQGRLKAASGLSPCVDPHRLSSIRILEPSLEPYGCGHPSCWPGEMSSGKFSFLTSKDLLMHVKASHGEDSMRYKVFRCTLSHCGKSWKVTHVMLPRTPMTVPYRQ